MPRHDCNRYGAGIDWAMCVVCDGRIHHNGCTSRRDKNKDCCMARHRMLFDQGQTHGIYDSSVHMLADYEYDLLTPDRKHLLSPA